MTAAREDTAVRNCSTRPATPNRPLPVVLTHRLFRPGTSRPGRKTAPSSCSARQKKRQKKILPKLGTFFSAPKLARSRPTPVASGGPNPGAHGDATRGHGSRRNTAEKWIFSRREKKFSSRC
uniref:(northern house mosquito) hypothetical protein n=1 Tax=Culex pipiens TaxID=7175 RepID=A0A8D8NJ02_CULPI